MKVLFITRKYPPQVGGMEKYSYELIKNFPAEKKVIALNKSQKHLVWFLPYALIKGIFLAKRVDLVYLCDGLLAPIGFIIKKITKKPVFSTAHGLDITYNNWLHQKINVKALKYLDKIIAVSNSTIEECAKRGISHKKCVFIPNGIEINNKSKNFTKHDLSKFLGFNTIDKKNLLSVGRFVKRKGFAWFIDNVLPKLDSSIIYLIVGEGQERKRILNTINKHKLSNRVFLLGRISNSNLELVYKTSDIFVMPNIKVKDDMEGFGIVAIEAAAHGLPVIASKMEGIQDAIYHNKNGLLVEPQNKEEYIREITKLLNNDRERRKFGKRAKKFTVENFSWNKICSLYLEEFKKIINKDVN